MKILKLIASNVLRLHAVTITTAGKNAVIIGGKNDQGKTSVLNCIEMAFSGKDAVPDRPIHEGETSGYIIVETDDYTIKRTFTEKGTYITVDTKEKARIPAPQVLLDQLISKLSFDPLEFVRLDAKAKRSTLLKALGIDFTTLEGQRLRMFEDRTIINREIKSIDGAFMQIPTYTGLPDKEITTDEMTDRMNEALATNNKISTIHADIERFRNARNVHMNNKKRLAEQIFELQAQLESVEKGIIGNQKQSEAAQTELSTLAAVDMEAMRKDIVAAQQTNKKIAEKNKKDALGKSLESKKAEAEQLTKDIEGIDLQKGEMIRMAKFPVTGLAFDGDGVLFDGIPFDQLSESKKLTISFHIGMALNPNLRVLLVRDGAILDDDNLKILADLAEKADFQVWIERVGDGSECHIVIEDGNVKEDRTAS